jgi:hypothetical protein
MVKNVGVGSPGITTVAVTDDKKDYQGESGGYIVHK